MNKPKRWFKKAVKAKPPYTLGGWSKHQSPTVRRRYVLESRPQNWTLKNRHRSAGQALQALANVTTDPRTKKLAALDARYFFSKLR